MKFPDDDAFRDAVTFGTGMWNGTASTGSTNSTLTAAALSQMAEALFAEKAPPKLLIRENAFMSSTDVVRVTVKRYRLSSKGCRRKWIWEGEAYTAHRVVPTTKAYQLPDGSIVCHPTVADRIRKTLDNKEHGTWPMKLI